MATDLDEEPEVAFTRLELEQSRGLPPTVGRALTPGQPAGVNGNGGSHPDSAPTMTEVKVVASGPALEKGRCVECGQPARSGQTCSPACRKARKARLERERQDRIRAIRRPAVVLEAPETGAGALNGSQGHTEAVNGSDGHQGTLVALGPSPDLVTAPTASAIPFPKGIGIADLVPLVTSAGLVVTLRGLVDGLEVEVAAR